MAETDYDVFIIGGGINGCGIARDAAGRGLKVGLAEMNDLASATSSSSTKLFHGGLRYLEYFEFRLVREALMEREILLRAMPHISWPMRFVLPYHRDMRFENDTPTSKLLSFVMPWMKGRRPAWLIRLGLFLYDNLGGRKILPGTSTVFLKGRAEGAPLQERFEMAYEYSDCWVEDSRLVVLNARDAAMRGADVMTRTRVVSADRRDGYWEVVLEAGGAQRTVTAGMLVNAGGPWVGDIIRNTVRSNATEGVRLVRGSHIVTRRLFDHDKCYFFQGTDGRIIFAIPYEGDFTLIGTTDAEHADPSQNPECTPEERDYLLAFASQYFKEPLGIEDVVWTYSGVRPLYDDGATSATAATRDYVLKVDDTGGAPVLNVFGGKITTYRRLAESALEKIKRYFPGTPGAWTAGVPLPGGNFPVEGAGRLVAGLQRDYPFLSEVQAWRLVRAYGLEARAMLGDARSSEDLGEDFGAGVTARELDWAAGNEWVRTAEDFVWRRTKLGLRLSEDQVGRIEGYLRGVAPAP
ncbi:MAG: glycerol-3-phosphate dehydrogenase [Pseudomonadota bacterium]